MFNSSINLCESHKIEDDSDQSYMVSEGIKEDDDNAYHSFDEDFDSSFIHQIEDTMRDVASGSRRTNHFQEINTGKKNQIYLFEKFVRERPGFHPPPSNFMALNTL